ncbi:Protein CBG13705 [Caenorhabditis briggsae]|uniref:Protein CBG13705 n=1 Tax=Caenorhabditis briggsae TaxID=6238 RepID=A8XII5_CAEBR|nr:Protein CBG13705 [Caenorhabditis briggsae]CAP32459.2 Protein CBG13705 [Caenorhabditis briggsae]
MQQQSLIFFYVVVVHKNSQPFQEDPTKKFVHLHRRQQLPSINLPTYLPDGDSSSRDGSPYLPPEEIRSAKKA